MSKRRSITDMKRSIAGKRNRIRKEKKRLAKLEKLSKQSAKLSQELSALYNKSIKLGYGSIYPSDKRESDDRERDWPPITSYQS